jgi:Rps23 Pro-64 3,4-dihydroxylase Tpa1-like proline 4-hydroxylase
MELLVKPEILTSCVYMDLNLATLNAVSFYMLHNVSKLNQGRKFSCITVVCRHFASYQDYPNYKWDLIQ